MGTDEELKTSIGGWTMAVLSLNLRSRSSTTLLPISTNHEPPPLFRINLFSQVGTIDDKTALLGMSLAASQSNGIIFHTGNSEGPRPHAPVSIYVAASISQPCFFGLGFGGLGFGVLGFGLALGLGFRGFGVRGLGSRVWGLGVTTNSLQPTIALAPNAPLLHSSPTQSTTPSHTASTIPIELPYSQPTTQPPTIPNDPKSTSQPPQDCSLILQSAMAPIALHTNLFQPLDTATCMENKMASLQSQSDASSAIEVSVETSTASVLPSDSHDDSPVPSPKTVRKKKGGRKRKEVKDL
uniref:Uncharacterized protein n=1 Tax=Populus alba TaxID=43335 RepID=A0A4U5QBH6_POPAL|nr:hypothetical protein D5086_0000109880 [Populus alba]